MKPLTVISLPFCAQRVWMIRLVLRAQQMGEKIFQWEKMGFQGHPLNALRLPDSRVLLTYGYRHKPYGIRARILNAECTDFATAPEIVLRDDGINGDLGYSWPVQLDKKQGSGGVLLQ